MSPIMAASEFSSGVGLEKYACDHERPIEVKSTSVNDRPLIALGSPGRSAESGPPISRSEKKGCRWSLEAVPLPASSVSAVRLRAEVGERGKRARGG